jgi:paraquat-inducible protein B
MGSKISPTMIGAFVVGAIVLVVAGALLFGGGKFFQEKIPYVLFFDSSVEGLNVGAPVIFRGVQLGQVTEIAAIADPQTFDVRIRVKIEIVRGVLKVGEEGQLFRFRDPRAGVEGLIQKGARATLRMQSFVTGVLYIAIDFFPDTPVRLLGLDKTLPELPTIPSEMDQLKSTLQDSMAEIKKLPLGAVVAEALTVLKRINALLELPELKQALVTLHGVMTDARQLLHKADGQVEALGPKLAGTAEIAAKTLLDAQKLLRDVDGQVAPLAGGAKETLTSAKEALTAARSALGQVQKSLVTLTEATTPVLKQADRALTGTTALTGPDSAVINDLSRTLRSLDEAARAIRTLASTLERNPEMLIRGRSK